MKIRSGFVSNSSTASFIIKTRPTNKNGKEDLFILSKEKIELLKKYGFYPTKECNPFRVKLNTYSFIKDEIDDTLLGYWMSCNQEFVLEFLVANNIPFKASIHYNHYLYSYDPQDEFIYILHNFGLQHINEPKQLEKAMQNDEIKKYTNVEPFEKISKKEFLENYNEESSIEFMKEQL